MKTLDDVTHTDPSMMVEGGDARMLPVLHVVHHPDPSLVGARVVLSPGQELEIGRRGSAFGPGLLDDGLLSRHHATLAWLGSGVVVQDQDSRNGVWVNGQRVRRAGLSPGDVLGVGDMLLLLGFGQAEAPVVDGGALLGRSVALSRAVADLDLAAPRDTTVLLLGETGTGKELAARELHKRSGRTGALVPVNCGAIGGSVLQDELFGHVRGAFTGAAGVRGGLVAAAEGGTLFLDEIGDAPADVQVALLRLLQEREVRPVGADAPYTVDVRFVAATHQDLDGLVAEGRFRRDLAARLRRWTVRLPALRERREDVPLLVRHIAKRLTGRDVQMTRGVALRLILHRWPDNVRELEAVVERLAVEAGDGDTLTEPQWLVSLLDSESTTPVPPERSSAARRSWESAAPVAPAAVPAAVPAPAAAPAPASARPVRPSGPELEEQLRQLDGNVRSLAEQLGVSRNTLYKWFKRYGIDPGSFRPAGSGRGVKGFADSEPSDS
jgi:DNA-binding NtrC family response regulator